MLISIMFGLRESQQVQNHCSKRFYASEVRQNEAIELIRL